MPNITVFLDEETYRRARIWAADRGTSIPAIVKCILVTLPTRATAPRKQTPRTLPRPELVRPRTSPSNYATLPVTDPPATTPAAASVSPDTSTPSTPAAEVAWIPAWGLTVLRAVREQLHPHTLRAADKGPIRPWNREPARLIPSEGNVFNSLRQAKRAPLTTVSRPKHRQKALKIAQFPPQNRGKQPSLPLWKAWFEASGKNLFTLFESDGTLAPALEPNRAAAALAQPSKILPVVAPIHPAQFNPGNTIKWNKVL
jgi:hypothetical protein